MNSNMDVYANMEVYVEGMIASSRSRLRLLPASHPHRPDLLHILAVSLAARSSSRSNPTELEEAIEILRKLLKTTPQQHPSYSLFLFDLAELFRGRFEADRESRFHDLEESIALHRDALRLRPAPHPERILSLTKLELVFAVYFELKGAPPNFQEYIQISREALDLHTPSQPSYCPILSNLANVLFTQFRKDGTKEDLEESIVLYYKLLGMKNNPDRSTTLYNLANALYVRFNQDSQLRDLEESILLYRKALCLQPAFHPDRGKSLLYLGTALSSRFSIKGECQDLDDAISMFRAVLGSRTSPHPDDCSSLNAVAKAVPDRFDRNGDLEGCIVLGCEALKLQSTLPPDVSLVALSSIGDALLFRFEQRGNFQDLEESILLHREALALQRTHRLPAHCSSLYSLGSSLRVRFDHRGNVQDLEESISLFKEALNSTSISEPSYPLVLANLAMAMWTRCEYRRTLQELDEIVLLCRTALGTQPAASHYNRSVMLSQLSVALFTRFRENQISDDIAECILLHREALRLRPWPHPYRNVSLVNLATSLIARFRHKGSLSDLDEGIMLYKEALSSLPHNHSNYLWSLRELASALADGCDAKANAGDLDEAIALYKRVASLEHGSDPKHVATLLNLGKSLRQRFEYNGSEEDIEDALYYFEEASKCQAGFIFSRFEASMIWANCAEKHRCGSALRAYSYAISLLPLLASSDLTLGQRYDVLRHGRMLAGSATKSAIDANQYTDAVSFLSTGRSVFWSQALQLRTSVEELADSHPTLAEEYTAVSKLLEEASYAKHQSILDSSSQRQIYATTQTSPSTLTDRRNRILAEIRRIPGFDGFLLPSAFSSLQAAADRGPVVLLNACQLGCDVLILRKTGSVDLVPLRVNMKWLVSLAGYFDMLLDAAAVAARTPQEGSSLQGPSESGTDFDSSSRRQIHQTDFNYLWETAVQQAGCRPEIESAELIPVGRDMTRATMTDFEFLEVNEKIFRRMLMCLWLGVVGPVVHALRLEKMTEPPRVWWCPAGPFTSLPLHAAGIYSKDSKPIDCVFEYAISSYCTSPQDLLHPSSQISSDFRMTTIIEPNAPGSQPLPATHQELQVIEKHVPQNLVTHIGSKATPTQTENLLSDIQKSSFVHFGCHGKQDLDNPLESYLLLSSGKLTMSRIMKECRVPEGALAYLSACETAKTDVARPDESLNLVATMMFAGFRSVVGTMQSIFDEDAPVVADVFYGHLFRNGKEALPDVRDAAMGLHLATKELRDRGKPFHGWVPYVHYGI